MLIATLLVLLLWWVGAGSQTSTGAPSGRWPDP